MKAVLSVALLGHFASALVCYPYKCGSLEENVCATLSEGMITINEDGCSDSDLVCSVSEAYAYFINEGMPSNSYDCTDDEYYDYIKKQVEELEDLDSSDWAKSDICEYDSTKEFASDVQEKDGYKICQTDADCLLVDGTTTSCVCGLNTVAYCTPAWGSSFYNEWYDICKDDDANVDYFKYFVTKGALLSYILTVDDNEDYECISDVSVESDIWDDAESDYEDEKEDDDDDGAIHLILSSLVGLLLLA